MNFFSAWLLKRQLRSGSSSTGPEAVRRLAADGSPAAMALLAIAVNGEDMTVARVAMKALIARATPEAIAALGTALRAALVTRAQGKPASGDGPYYAAGHRVQELVNEIAKLGPPAAPLLLDALQRRGAELAAPRPYGVGEHHTASAAWDLGQLKYAPAVPTLIAALSDPSERVRCAAAGALGAMKAKVAVPNLIAGLEDRDGTVRREACTALADIGDPRAAPEIEKLLDDRETWVRATAAEALAKLGWRPSSPEGRARAALAAQDWSALGREGAAALRPILAAIWMAYGLEVPRGKANPWERLSKKSTDPKYLPQDRIVGGLVDALGASLQGQGPFDARDVGYVAAMPDLRVQYEAQIERMDHGSGNEYIDRVTCERVIDCNALRTRARALG